MLRIAPLMTLVALFVSPLLHAEDWPAYRHDNGRTGATSETLDAKDLQPDWTLRSPVPPQQAWHGPAKWDAYHGKAPLSEMRNYDPVFFPIVVGKDLFYGSSADDAVHCLDTRTGREQWRFTTSGPIRIAPMHHDGKLYFGSDDGFAYCIAADTGKLVWKYSPTAGRRLLINNGRLISFWPIRTGVTVDRGTAYFAASMLPWKESYLCAVDAKTGKPEGPGRFVEVLDGLTFEGAFAISRQFLFTPQGRLWGLVYDRSDGRRRADIPGGGGGCFVMVTDDGHVAGGPASRGLAVGEANFQNPKEKAYSHGGAKAMVVRGGAAYLITDTALYAIDRASKKRTWSVNPGPCHGLIAAGDTVFLGSRDKVLGYRATDGQLVWQAPVRGKAYGMAVADGALFVSTHEGAIHCFRPGAAPEPEKPAEKKEVPAKKKEPAKVRLAAGPYARFTSSDTAIVRWWTEKPSPTILVLDDAKRFEDKTPKTVHQVRIDQLRPGRDYTYEIHTLVDGKPAVAPKRTLETFFNYNVPPVAAALRPYRPDTLTPVYKRAAKRILASAGTDRGLCLVLGSGEGRLAFEIARRSRMRVICLDTDGAAVDAARATLQRTGVYGSRIAVLKVDSYSDLPLPPYAANVIASESVLAGGACPIAPAELARVLRPNGGVACLGQPAGAPKPLDRAKLAAWLADVPLKGKRLASGDDGIWAVIRRDRPLPGAGEWSHQYARPDNSTSSGETLGGAKKTTDLEVLWLGRPGPRYQADRQVRKPAPLAINGRLFMQGLERLIAVDSFNGSVLWALEVPELKRFNMPRDASNYCADRDHVYVAARDKCWRIDARTGQVVKMLDVVPAPNKDWPFAWGYVASVGDRLIGTSTKEGTGFTGFWGSGSWFDSRGGWDTAKVCSDNIFAIDKNSGSTKWAYSKGVIINTAIAIGGGRVYLVESRNKKIKDLDKRVIGEGELWQEMVLVALDLKSGKKLWEKPIQPAAGVVMFSLSYGAEKLVLLSSGGGRYNAYTFDAPDGKPTWKAAFGWSGGDHGAHMARPVIVGNKLYVPPAGFNLKTGERMKDGIPGGRCGTVSAGADALFFRGGGSVTMWAPSTKDWTSWGRLRPDCWLSTIPANGMVLSPEGGGGCWCSVWMETSVGFVRPTRPRPEFAAGERQFIGSLAVELKSPAPAATTRYTLDGSEPTIRSPEYTKPITLRKQTIIKARTFWDRPGAYGPASGHTLVGRFERLYPAPEFVSQAKLFADSKKIRLRKEDPEGDIRYTLDGKQPTKESTQYTEPFEITKTTTVIAGIFYPTGKVSSIAQITYSKAKTIRHEGKKLIPGLRYTYSEGWCSKFDDPNKKFEKIKTGEVGNFDISPRKRNDGFAFNYSGYIDIPKDGTYTFHLQSDDGSRLHINGKLVADNDGVHDARGIRSGKVELKAGAHPIVVEFFECVGGEVLKVLWEGPDLKRQPVPDTALYMEEEKGK